MSNMEDESPDHKRNTINSSDKSSAERTSEVYRVNNNLPKRFNNPESFRGYSKKPIHPLYQTSNQIYGGRKPTVHEMPTTFHGSQRKFSEHILRSGMYRDNGFNTSLEKNLVTGPSAITKRHDRIVFHQSYHSGGSEKTGTSRA
ncbi:piercer of microtubule wall 2 protein [Hoplias malabaricus]|uniref:piercer of microtubule wall 2 protein n=1 Tax=Hoplias malabaricus TaxID=27720 RepID=UPI003461E267